VALAPASDTDPWGAALLVLRILVLAVAVFAWGRFSGWSWIAAALVFDALGGLRSAAYAPTGQEQLAGALTVVVAGALVALIVRHVRRAAKRAPM